MAGSSEPLNRAADYIQDHFAEDLSLDKLAAVAHYSKYHFHRLFREHFGETVNTRIRRIRLEQAARRLIANSGASMDEIAASCGFSSSQNFARSFKAQLGLAPSSVRKNPDRLLIGQTSTLPAAIKKEPLAVEIRDWASGRAACIRNIGPYGSASHDGAIERLLHWSVTAGYLDAGTRLLGVCRSDIETTPPQECVFDVCLTVPERAKGDREVLIRHLSGGKLAVLHCEVEREEISDRMDRFVREWLPSSGYLREERPFFFIYYNNPRMNRRKLALVDMCLPIRS